MLWFSFARRYMFSPKSHSVINIIAAVSVIAVAVPTAAMVILLSMFGGLDKTIHDIYSSSDADIEITSREGHTFNLETIDLEAISKVEGIEAHTAYIEQSVMIGGRSERTVTTLRGIDSNYGAVFTIDDYIVNGSLKSIAEGGILLGATVAYNIGANYIGAPIELYALNRKQISTLLPTSGLTRTRGYVGGIVMANAELDAATLLVDITEAQRLLNHEGRVTNISLNIAEGGNTEHIRNELQRIAGDNFEVKTRKEKNASMSEIMELEKFVIVLIGCFIALIAAFSIIGSVVMLMTEKRRDIATLRALGCDKSLIRRIFVGEGMLLTITGTAIGLILGIGFCLLQQHYGLIPIEGNMVIESYPVVINTLDIVIVTIIMVAIGGLISRLTVGATLKRAREER